MCFSESALCRREWTDVEACAACCVSLLIMYTLYQRSEAQVLCAFVCSNHSNSSTGLQHQKQQQYSFASVVPSPGIAAGKPYSCCGQGVVTSLQSSHRQQQYYSCTTLFGNVIPPNGHCIRVFAIYQMMLGWKTYKYYYETDELPNPRPSQPKKK